MQLEKYVLKAEDDTTIFQFISEGPKGLISKLILFQRTSKSKFYNLAFGDKNPQSGELDDLVTTNNGDREKVLATVIAALYAFFDKYPDAFVYAKGSSSARTRLYRMGISRFYKEMINNFEIYGQIGDNFYKFEIGTNYSAFLVQRKFN